MNINYKVENKNITIDVNYGHKLTRDTIIEKAGLSVYNESRSFNDHIVLADGKFDNGYPCYEDSELIINWGIEMGGKFAPINSPVNLTIKVAPEEVIEVAEAQQEETVIVTELENVEKLNDRETRYQTMISLGDIPGEYSIPPLEFKLPEGNLVGADFRVIPVLGNQYILEDKSLVDFSDVEIIDGKMLWQVDQSNMLPFGNNPDDIYGLIYLIDLEFEPEITIAPEPVKKSSSAWDTFLSKKDEELGEKEVEIEDADPVKETSFIQDFSKTSEKQEKPDDFGLNIDEAFGTDVDPFKDQLKKKQESESFSDFKEITAQDYEDQVPSFRQAQSPILEKEEVPPEFSEFKGFTDDFREIGVANDLNTGSNEPILDMNLDDIPTNGKKGKKAKKVKEPKIKKEKGEKNLSKTLKISVISAILVFVMGGSGLTYYFYNSSMKSISKEVTMIENNNEKTEKILKKKELNSEEIDQISQLLNNNEAELNALEKGKNGKKPGFFVKNKRTKMITEHNKLIDKATKKLNQTTNGGSEETDSSN